MNAADAITGAPGPSPFRSRPWPAARLLDQAGADGKDASKYLRRLLPLKNRAEDEPAHVTRSQAAAAVAAAGRMVAIAERASASLSR
jgi:hypothetical protein